MSKPQFKYTDATNEVVSRTWPDGRCESSLATSEVIEQYLAEGGVILPADAPSAEEQKAAVEAAIQEKLDETARAHGYDSLRSAISYRGSSNATWAAEADAFFAWRDAVWAKAIAVQQDVAAGTAQMPTIDEALAMMPALKLA